jgi:hypothetical protein
MQALPEYPEHLKIGVSDWQGSKAGLTTSASAVE